MVLAPLSHSALAAIYVVPADDALIGKADAIVVARAIHSDVRESDRRGIETVTIFALEEVLKGDSIDSGFAVDVPGGTLARRGRTLSKFIPGAARFVDGDRVLLFLNRIGDTEYAVTDLGLGFFGFAYDESGRRVLVRPVDADSKYRDADAFARYIRGRVAGQPVLADYSVEAKPLVGRSPSLKATILGLDPKTFTCSGCTVTQYTSGSTETAAGYRWKTSPINWNRGNTEPNATSNGDDAISNAFAQWANASSATYVSSTTTSNASGILESPDGVNNIVFEKDMTSIGVGAFNCSAGGLLGIGGINTSTTDSSNTVNGETFYSTSEGDVSMNQGIGACLGSGQLTQGDFRSAVMHEVGHTLGLRHADQSRDDSQPCTTFPSYDCASSAIMTTLLTSNLNGAIQTWDQRAITALYPASAFAAPTGVIAIVNSTGSVSVSWNAVSGAVGGSTVYQVYRTSDNINYGQICTATAPDTACTDSFTSVGTAYLYKVRVGSSGAFSPPDLATAVIFTDDPLVKQQTSVKAVHITQLRTAVDAVRKLANGGVANPYSYTDPNLTSGVTYIKAVHVSDLRTALNTARLTLGIGAIAFNPTLVPGSTIVGADHITDLRNGVRRHP
ncbi:MAG TPA: hypothetical protein VGR95_04715 [Thermoanaerobaculia bacterium]|jgi:hypothetical protein|nr:hypothetical protein [Thermoanaerobaculia bacterium]